MFFEFIVHCVLFSTRIINRKNEEMMHRLATVCISATILSHVLHVYGILLYTGKSFLLCEALSSSLPFSDQYLMQAY